MAPVEGLERYMVSREGIVINAITGRTMKPIVNNCGYMVVRMRGFGKQHNRLVHRLVASAFIDNSQNKPQVNHIDRDKFNNAVANLEWVTRRENIDHAVEGGYFKNVHYKIRRAQQKA